MAGRMIEQDADSPRVDRLQAGHHSAEIDRVDNGTISHNVRDPAGYTRVSQ